MAQEPLALISGPWPILKVLLWFPSLIAPSGTGSCLLSSRTLFHPSFSPSGTPLPTRAPPWALGTLMSLPFRPGISLSNRSLSFQGSAAYEFLSVDYTERKWKGPALSQRAVYRSLMPENYRRVASLGNDSVPQQRSLHSIRFLCYVLLFQVFIAKSCKRKTKYREQCNELSRTHHSAF